MADKFVLDGHKAVPCEDFEAWIDFMESENLHVKTTHTGPPPFYVSTVFLGLDHSFGAGPLQIFETMVFNEGCWDDLACQRYATWEEAEAGHDALVARVNAGEFNDAASD